MANLTQLLERLLASKLDFVLVGAYAGVVHGSSYVTKDIDICMALNPATIQKLRSILSDLEPVHRVPKKLSFLEHPSDLTHVKNIYLQTKLGPLDILSEIIGVGPYEKVAERAIQIPLLGHNCKVIHLDHLIASKIALGREKDRVAIAELELIREKNK